MLLTILAQKFQHRLFDWVLNTALGNTVIESSHLKRYFPSSVKLFVSSFLSYFLLSQKSEKPVTERNKRLNLWSLFIAWGNPFLIPPGWIIENGFCQIACVVLEFLGLFFALCLAKTQKNNCDLFKVVAKENEYSQFWLVQSWQNEYQL